MVTKGRKLWLQKNSFFLDVLFLPCFMSHVAIYQSMDLNFRCAFHMFCVAFGNFLQIFNSATRVLINLWQRTVDSSKCDLGCSIKCCFINIYNNSSWWQHWEPKKIGNVVQVPFRVDFFLEACRSHLPWFCFGFHFCCFNFGLVWDFFFREKGFFYWKSKFSLSAV